MAKAGNPSAHDSAVAHVTGQARYVDDMEASVDQLHIALGLTTIARGRLVSLDLEPVKRAAGVVDVMRFSDLDHATDIGPVFPGDPLFVENDISFYGQTLFAVAAMSQQAARKAILLADVQYEEQAPELELSTSLARGI